MPMSEVCNHKKQGSEASLRGSERKDYILLTREVGYPLANPLCMGLNLSVRREQGPSHSLCLGVYKLLDYFFLYIAFLSNQCIIIHLLI